MSGWISPKVTFANHAQYVTDSGSTYNGQTSPCVAHAWILEKTLLTEKPLYYRLLELHFKLCKNRPLNLFICNGDIRFALYICKTCRMPQTSEAVWKNCLKKLSIESLKKLLSSNKKYPTFLSLTDNRQTLLCISRRERNSVLAHSKHRYMIIADPVGCCLRLLLRNIMVSRFSRSVGFLTERT